MTRVTLILWSPEEAARRAEELTASGFDVSVFSDRKSDPRALRHDPPDAFLIDLARSPAQGRELGGWLRRQKATRQRPLVFIEGDPEKTEKARALLPDAAFTTWESAAAEVSRAVAEAPKDPVVPGAMDAYAGASLVKKLGIREGHLVGLVEGPEGFEGLLRETPKGVRIAQNLQESPNVLLLFVRSSDELERTFPAVARRLADGGKLWICWPKRASGVATNLSQKVVRAFGLARAFVDYKIASIDETWSGLCFARRE